MTTPTMNANFVEDSIFKQIFSQDIKSTENTITDEEYNEMLNKFRTMIESGAIPTPPTPAQKLKHKLEIMKESRQRESFRGLKKGFLL